MMLRWMGVSILIGAALPMAAQSAGPGDLNAAAEKQLPALTEVYKHLHENPELSGHEVKTAAFVAGGAAQAGLYGDGARGQV